MFNEAIADYEDTTKFSDDYLRNNLNHKQSKCAYSVNDVLAREGPVFQKIQKSATADSTLRDQGSVFSNFSFHTLEDSFDDQTQTNTFTCLNKALSIVTEKDKFVNNESADCDGMVYESERAFFFANQRGTVQGIKCVMFTHL